MAWTAPRTWVVSELVTAALMNTHIRDQFDYLKGNAGAVVISDTLQATKLGLGVAPSASYTAYILGNLPMRLEQTSSGIDYLDLNNTAAAGNRWALRIRDLAEGDFGIRDVTAGAYRLYITSTGNVGLGIATPTNKLHVKGSIVNWVFWEGDAIDGTARTVLANSSALYAQAGFAITRPSNGATPNVLSLNATSLAGTTLYSVAGDQCLLTAGSGGYIVQRTSGSLTYKVALVLMTI